MVAELTDIPVANAERKPPTADQEKARSSCKKKNRPKWIQAATREPIYSVLDGNEKTGSDLPSGVKCNVVVISAVKSDIVRKSGKPEVPRDPHRELPRVRLPPDDRGKSTSQDATIHETEDEDPLYSVVRKPKKVRPSEAVVVERKLQPIQEQITEDKQAQRSVCSRQEELRRWLQVASTQLPEPRRLFNLGEMYKNHSGEFDQLEDDWGRAVSVPRGIVGLVGPYRVYQNPNERREYMLQEEELVEEVVDSVSEIVARGNNAAGEHHQRAKWRIREDDEDTLVPDIRDIPGLEDFTVDTANKDVSEWKSVGDTGTMDYKRCNDTKQSKKDEFEGGIGGIVSGKEERAVDVPDEEASTVSTSSIKDKKGERTIFFRLNNAVRQFDTFIAKGNRRDLCR